MTDISFTVGEKGITLDPPEQPTQRPALPRPIKNRDREKQDALRRPQAAVLYRRLRERLDGMSWRECWELGAGDAEWAVGPIVIWLRAHDVPVHAEYDTSAGETRFYLVVL